MSKRLTAAIVVLTIATLTSAAANAIVHVPKTHAATNTPLCVQRPQMCTELTDPWTWNGYTYTSGHDEPSALFYSTVPGSGNSNQYNLTLPTDPVGCAEAGRDRQHVELPAPSGLLVRDGHVRRPGRAEPGCGLCSR